MANPFANRSVKCAFRWHHRANLRARRLSQCVDPLKECPRPLYFPESTLLPFQIFAGNAQDGNYGDSTPTAWVIKDLDGVVVFDMAAYLNELHVEQFANPTREHIILDIPLIVDHVFQDGVLYESEITTDGGVYFSETFTFFCGNLYRDAISNPTPGEECTNWSYGIWAGTVQGVVQNNSELPPGAGSNTYISLDDGMIYSWNGSGYDANPGTEGNYYTTANMCDPIYRFHGDTFTEISGINAPFDPAGLCWHLGAEIPVLYDLGADLGQTTLVRLRLRAFFGSPVSGELGVYVDGDLVHTFNTANHGQDVEIDIVLDGDSTIEFLPTEGYQGCLQLFEMLTFTSGDECYHRLTWSNCGDIGTQRYFNRDFINYLYLDSRKDKILFPVVEFKVKNRQDTKEGDVVETMRKEVRWEIEMERGVPWYLLDALTEIPLHDTVTLKIANNEDDTVIPTRPVGIDGIDFLSNVQVQGVWPKPDACLADCTFTFQLDEASYRTGCCDGFDPQCIPPCITADWVRSEHGETEDDLGDAFLMEDGTWAIYWGNDQEEHQVDLEGFGARTPCTYALTTQEGFESVYYTGEQWFPAVYITDVITNDCEAGSLNISGNVMAQFGVKIQYSFNGTTWVYVTPDIVYSSNQIGSGVDVIVPASAPFVRLELVGTDCTQGFSTRYDNPCFVCCTETDLIVSRLIPPTNGSGTYHHDGTQNGKPLYRVGVSDTLTEWTAHGTWWAHDANGVGIASASAVDFPCQATEWYESDDGNPANFGALLDPQPFVCGGVIP